METILPIVLMSLAFIVIFGLAIARGANRLSTALERVGSIKANAAIYSRLSSMLAKAGAKAYSTYIFSAVIFIISLLIICTLVGSLEEPRAQVVSFVMIQMIYYGIPLLVGLVMIGFVVSISWKTYKANQFFNEYLAKHPKARAIAEAQVIIEGRPGEAGLSTLSAAAVIGSVIVGAAFVIVFIMATQAAIECARSSKCM